MSEVAQAPQLRFPEFIGEWDVTNFGNISSIKRGASPRPISSPKWFDKDSSVGWVRISDVTKSKKYLKKTEQYLSEDGINRSRKVDKGNLIMSICATIGKPIYTNFNVCIHDGFIVFDSLSEDKGFIYYLLEKIQKKWYRYGQPGTQVNLNSDIVSSEIFSIPTKPEQQKIAAFLAAVDSKIEQLSKKQELLGEYKKGSMQQIFSQAIRFHSKGTSSQAQGEIDDTPGQPLLPNGNSPSGSDFPDWEEKKLGDITDLITKGTTPTSVGYNFTTEGINFIKVESIKNFKIDIGSVPKISEECHHHLKRSQLKNNDIVFSIAGTLGRTAIVKNKDLPANTNQALSIIRLNRSQHILFVHYLLNLESIDKYIHRMLSVGAQPNLSLQQVGDIQLQLPSLLEQSKITNFLSFIDSKIEQVGKQLDESKQFKKALLQQMFI